MCCVCAGTCNHVGNHTFCHAHGGGPATTSPPAFGSYSYTLPVTSAWGPYCVTCGHPADRHGRTFCTVVAGGTVAGGTSQRPCDCDGYNDGGDEEPPPLEADPCDSSTKAAGASA